MAGAENWPITLEQAAERLHVRNIRWLRELAKRIGCGRRVPGTIIFDEREFRQLYESLPVPGSNASKIMAPLGPSDEEIRRRIEKHLVRCRGRRGPRNYLKDAKVINFDKKP